MKIYRPINELIYILIFNFRTPLFAFDAAKHDYVLQGTYSVYQLNKIEFKLFSFLTLYGTRCILIKNTSFHVSTKLFRYFNASSNFPINVSSKF